MTSLRPTKPTSNSYSERADLWLFILLGTLLAGFGSAAYFDREAYNAPAWLGPFLLWVAATFTLIGVIGLGVLMGLRAAASGAGRRQ